MEPKGEDTKKKTELYNIMYDIIPDTGADIDVIGRKQLNSVRNIKDSQSIILKGASGECQLSKMGDIAYVEGLNTEQGLLNPNSDITCLSIPERTQKGWKFWAEGKIAKLISPVKKVYNFVIKDGLYRLTDKVEEGFEAPQEVQIEVEDNEEDKQRQRWKQAHSSKVKQQRKGYDINTLMFIMTIAVALGSPGIGAMPFIKQLNLPILNKHEILSQFRKVL